MSNNEEDVGKKKGAVEKRERKRKRCMRRMDMKTKRRKKISNILFLLVIITPHEAHIVQHCLLYESCEILTCLEVKLHPFENLVLKFAPHICRLCDKGAES